MQSVQSEDTSNDLTIYLTYDAYVNSMFEDENCGDCQQTPSSIAVTITFIWWTSRIPISWSLILLHPRYVSHMAKCCMALTRVYDVAWARNNAHMRSARATSFLSGHSQEWKFWSASKCEAALADTEEWYEISGSAKGKEKRWNSLRRLVRGLASTDSSRRWVEESNGFKEDSNIKSILMLLLTLLGHHRLRISVYVIRITQVERACIWRSRIHKASEGLALHQSNI